MWLNVLYTQELEFSIYLLSYESGLNASISGLYMEMLEIPTCSRSYSAYLSVHQRSYIPDKGDSSWINVFCIQGGFEI